MNIGKFSVKRPVTIAMCSLVLILFGVVSFTRMSVDLMPKMELPILAVMAPYDGAGRKKWKKWSPSRWKALWQGFPALTAFSLSARQVTPLSC